VANITIEITDTEMKGLESIAPSPQEWAENVVKNRARVANEAIVAKLVEHCNANDIALAVGVDAQVQQAYDLGVVDTVANLDAAALAAMQSE